MIIISKCLKKIVFFNVNFQFNFLDIYYNSFFAIIIET